MDPQQLRDVKRSLGGALARWRRARGLTQDDVARRVHSTRSTVANVECGRQVVDRVFWAQCESLLAAGGELIAGYDDYRSLEVQFRRDKAEAARQARWAGVLDPATLAETASPRGFRDHGEALLAELRGPTGGARVEGDMRRRVVLQHALIALSAGVAGPALDSIRAGLASPVLGQEPADVDVAEWEEVAEEYGRGYYSMTPVSLMLHLAADVADLQQTIEACRGSRRADLSRAGARLAGIMAMSLVKTGQFQAARRWWRTSRAAADASGDPAVRVWVRSQDAVHALYQHRSTRAAMDRAGEAVAISGGRAYPGTAEALGACAQASALAGDVAGAQGYIDLLTDVFDNLPDSVTVDTGNIYHWPQRRLWHTASYVHSHLGRSLDAQRAQEQALSSIPDWAPAARAQVHLHSAMCLIRDGHLDDGANHARQAITVLPESRRTTLVVHLARAALDAVPHSEQRRPAVTDLRELITACGPVPR
ncbi:helix-turn-helix domain-containing protein [Micromonospora sp. S-DT3-3-22]|uniref:helix-turn-helix domain-containing protein n=1 Tax=Micromonospora sp. S-DT3-3-22 TaxID=2755359 RepID=UPI00188F128A|nr:helix-turn-helix domain-containing protein [Micromonospora sp. S-DT3-3-22]